VHRLLALNTEITTGQRLYAPFTNEPLRGGGGQPMLLP